MPHRTMSFATFGGDPGDSHDDSRPPMNFIAAVIADDAPRMRPVASWVAMFMPQVRAFCAVVDSLLTNLVPKVSTLATTCPHPSWTPPRRLSLIASAASLASVFKIPRIPVILPIEFLNTSAKREAAAPTFTRNGYSAPPSFIASVNAVAKS